MNGTNNTGFDLGTESTETQTPETTEQNPSIGKGIEQIRLGFIEIARHIEEGQVSMNDLAFVTHYCLDLLLLVHVQSKKLNENEESI